MLRDGGSLAALFSGTNGSAYCLHFQLISGTGLNGELVRLGYEKPIVFERLVFRDANKIEMKSLNEVEITWEHAKVLLRQIRRHLQNDRDLKWLSAMEESAETEGKLPAGVEP